MRQIAALYVMGDGPYAGLPGVDVWDEERDARLYRGPHPVVAHPPCERWGRYWSGGPNSKRKKKLGDDGGCFASALLAVRRFGGVLEHPEASHAFAHYGLMRPAWHGGWSGPDRFGGMVCCVSQGWYGHRARKMTWLYVVRCDVPELRWGPKPGCPRLDCGLSREKMARGQTRFEGERLSKKQRKATPIPFRDLLILIARTAR